MNIILPQELEKRLIRALKFSYWTNREQEPDPLPLNEFIIRSLESDCQCIEDDMILDEKGGFSGDRLHHDHKIVPFST